MANLLEVNNLTTRFFTEDGTVYAVNGVSFTLDEGESLAIVGESGSGKSVTVKSLIRLIPSPPGKITAGEVFYRDQDLLSLSENDLRKIRGKEITMIFQDPMTSLNPVLTVETQVAEALRLHMAMDKKAARARAVEMLKLVGIPNAEDRLKDYPHQFSGGQRQRIMIAMALSTNPTILIADEPTTALDVTIQAQIIDLVKELQRLLGMAIIWITHDLGVVAGLVQKVIVMYGGFIVEQAPVRDLYRHTSHPYTLGLLRSLPKIDAGSSQRLIPIEGSPPDQSVEPTFCPFAPRCAFVVQRCRQEVPPLVETAPDHFSACWRWEDVRAGATQ